MERLLQYLDDIEDLVYAVALRSERIMQALRFVAFMLTAVTAQALCIMLAIASPPLAVATASILVVTMLYRSAVNPIPAPAA